MKHPPSVVIALLALFFAAQLIGLFVLSKYVDVEATEETGVLTYKELPAGIERPDIAPDYSFIFLAAAVIAGTVILLLMIRFRAAILWKLWYLLAVALSLAIAWTAFVPARIAGTAAVAAALWKVFRPNFIVHNLTELFIYSGLAAIFVPIMNVFSAILLLLLISVYDMYAVWKSKHMISLAKFQSSSNLFAGLSIPKGNVKQPAMGGSKRPPSKKAKGVDEGRVAIVGGGDIGFPLLFAGVVMAQFGFYRAALIPVFATLALAALFLVSQRGKFYPAMPFITAGCLAAYSVISLLP